MLVAGGVLILALLGLGVWLGVSALHAQSDLRAASGYAERAKAALRSGAAASTTALFSVLGRAAGEGRSAVYSGVPGEQQVLAGTPLGRLAPDTPAPSAGLVVNNAAGNNLDYYLGRSINYIRPATGPLERAPRPSR